MLFKSLDAIILELVSFKRNQAARGVLDLCIILHEIDRITAALHDLFYLLFSVVNAAS
jgi:hypothetical protein